MTGQVYVKDGDGDTNVRTHLAGCRKPLFCKAKTTTKLCPGCSLSAKWADPEFRARHYAGCMAKIENDPAYKADLARRSTENTRRWRATPEGRAAMNERGRDNLKLASTPENLAKRKAAIRAIAYEGIPIARHDEVRKLARKMPAAEAKRVVMEDERIKAQREVARIAAEMRQRHERQKAQAW